ncbi:hypothetical protein GCM10023219_30870 [Stakelama sediminis]|uniref:DUF3240 domain-containing protein n=1 Tax=Stakelama sediminis TaxID=463200 RepID=A0A840Z0R6_9SPHN|nr:DUF3240 family protein [Stakelama sediminis]MBB5719721.1 hypothetical protein [Stakelama sediminis]
MAELRLTLYAAASDEGALIDALREPVEGAIHVRKETVHGRDFSDASTAERVTGKLDRIAIEFICPAERLDSIIAAAKQSRRSYPVRWLATEIRMSGRLS